MDAFVLAGPGIPNNLLHIRRLKACIFFLSDFFSVQLSR